MKKIKKIGQILIIILGVILFLNLVFLDYQFFFSTNNNQNSGLPKGETNEIKPPASSVIESDNCPKSCLNKINEAIASVSGQKVTERFIETQTSIPDTGSKEFFIPLDGLGSTTEGSWKDIPGMETYINRANYPDKISAVWEASLKVKDNNGEAHARLFNVTKNVAVDYSEIKAIGSDFQRVMSAKINLADGNNLYRVQLSSTTHYEVSIQGGKMKITAD